jgi:hypothetical protein
LPENEALDRAVYDHEIDEPHARGERRRRRVDDWGVGEELFDRMPSRFSAHALPRRDTHAPHRFAPSSGDSPSPAVPPSPAVSPEAPTVDLLAAIPAPVPGDTPRVDVAGRRTVVITGRPGPLGQIPIRRRPPRTATERIGARPDRIVAWAVALGILLILIAVATANAAIAPAFLLPLAAPRRARRFRLPPDHRRARDARPRTC